jgi:hypothetical protein
MASASDDGPNAPAGKTEAAATAATTNASSPAPGLGVSPMGDPLLRLLVANFVSFIVEESLYRTRALPLTATGLFPSFAGRPMREWRDFRSEFGPLFTF